MSRGALRRHLPAAALVLIVALLLAAGAPTRQPDGNRALLWAEGITGAELGLLVLAVAASTVTLQPLLRYIAAGLKGTLFAGPVLEPVRRLLVRRFQRRLERDSQRWQLLMARSSERPLNDQERDEVRNLEIRLSRQPTREAVSPTALGNILVAAEEYPEHNYGLESKVALPRLRLLVPDGALLELKEGQDDLEFTTEFAAALLFGSVVALGLVGVYAAWLLLPTSMLILAWLAYRNALVAAVRYGEIQRVLFDLYRVTLYEALHYRLPDSPADELRSGKELTMSLWRAPARNTSFEHEGGASA